MRSLLKTNQVSTTARLKILDSLFKAGGGHYGGALSVVEIIQSILSNCDICQRHITKDYFILSKGHAAIAYYALLDTMGYASFDLSCYGDASLGLGIHPNMHTNDWVHCSTGSLGQGLSIGLGIALALRGQQRGVWVVLGDGECQEGQIWETALLASRYKMDNLYAIVDFNSYQECNWKHEATLSQEPLPNPIDKWQAFGWHTDTTNGHSMNALSNWIKQAQQRTDKPSVLIAKTQKGAGVPYFEINPEISHCTDLSKNEYLFARKSLQEN